jgi:hypothetical protein
MRFRVFGDSDECVAPCLAPCLSEANRRDGSAPVGRGLRSLAMGKLAWLICAEPPGSRTTPFAACASMAGARPAFIFMQFGLDEERFTPLPVPQAASQAARWRPQTDPQSLLGPPMDLMSANTSWASLTLLTNVGSMEIAM